MAERTLLLRGGGQGLVDIRERFVNLLVFYYNITKNCYLFTLRLNIYQILYMPVYLVLLKSELIYYPKNRPKVILCHARLYGY